MAVAFASLASIAAADPCHAIPDRGPMPAFLSPGKVFAGPVAYVGDGDSLCVDIASSVYYVDHEAGEWWVEVRLADFYAPELHESGGERAKAALAKITKGRRLECLAQHRSYDRVVAVCKLQRVSVGDLMRRAGIEEGGRGGQ